MKFTKKELNDGMVIFDYHGVEIPIDIKTASGNFDFEMIAIASDAYEVDLSVNTFAFLINKKDDVKPIFDCFESYGTYIDVSNFVEVHYDSFIGDEWKNTIQYYDIRGNKI